jgi:hypothetical protein
MKCYLRPEARVELDDAALYYEGLRDGLGDELIDDFLLGIGAIEEAPLRWPEIVPGIRRFRLSRFRYRIVYRVLEQSIEVVAFAHTARRELYWRDRT